MTHLEMRTMSAFEYLRFYWPVGMVLVFLWLHYQSITHRGEFLVIAALTLFGVSRVMSSDVVPFFAVWLDPAPNILLRRVMQLHYAGQLIAAMSGACAVHRLAQRYSDTARTWNRKTKRWMETS